MSFGTSSCTPRFARRNMQLWARDMVGRRVALLPEIGYAIERPKCRLTATVHVPNLPPTKAQRAEDLLPLARAGMGGASRLRPCRR